MAAEIWAWWHQAIIWTNVDLSLVSSLTFTREQFHSQYPSCFSVWCVWNLYFSNYWHILLGPMSMHKSTTRIVFFFYLGLEYIPQSLLHCVVHINNSLKSLNFCPYQCSPYQSAFMHTVFQHSTGAIRGAKFADDILKCIFFNGKVWILILKSENLNL